MNENCPICKVPVKSAQGTSVDPKDGFTVWCGNLGCGMADWGHGSTVKAAFDIFSQKCGKATASEQS